VVGEILNALYSRYGFLLDNGFSLVLDSIDPMMVMLHYLDGVTFTAVGTTNCQRNKKT
jgi:hypothetical protein